MTVARTPSGETFVKQDTRSGWSAVPHGLWTANLSHGAKALLGWLHSHDSSYLSTLGVNRVEREFGGGGQCRVWLRELADHGYLATARAEGKYTITLLAEPWAKLHKRDGNRRAGNSRAGNRRAAATETDAPTATETAPIEEQGEDQGEHHLSTPPTPRKRGALAAVDEQFDNEFWPHYPRGKPGKGQSREYWRSKKMTVADRAAAVEGIQRHVAWWAEHGTDPQFIPASIVWLHQRRWEDDEPRQRLAVVDTDKVLRSRQRRATRAAIQTGSQT